MFMVIEQEFVVLHVPEFALIECVNVIWKQVRFHGETPATARKILNDLRTFPLIFHDAYELLMSAFDISLTNNLAIYDCIHIALADLLQIPLITVDTKQAKAAEAIGVSLKPITDFPEFVEPEL